MILLYFPGIFIKTSILQVNLKLETRQKMSKAPQNKEGEHSNVSAQNGKKKKKTISKEDIEQFITTYAKFKVPQKFFSRYRG